MATRKNQGIHRRTIIKEWEAYPPTHTGAELAKGTGDFRLVPRDYQVLEDLLHHNFLTNRHFRMFPSPMAASNRLRLLLREGLVAHTKVIALGSKKVKAWEYVYSLTTLGLECLILGGRQEAEERRDTWTPPYISNTDRNNVLHELAVADMCNGMLNHLEDKHIQAGWQGSRQTFQQVHPMMAGGQKLIIAPDAAVGLDTGDTILVEYEESMRPDKFSNRLSDYRRYFEHGSWESKYLVSPKVLISVSEMSDRQQYWANPFDQALKMGRLAVFLYKHVFLIREQNWRKGIWNAQPLAIGEKERPLHQILRG